MKFKNFLSTFLPLFLIIFLSLTLAWSPPTEQAPGGNPPSFLSVSSQTQFKEGALGVGGVFQAFVMQLYPDGATQPTCEAGSRGMMWLEEGGEGEDDLVAHCLRNSKGEYEWLTVVEATGWSCGDDFLDDRDNTTYSTVEIGSQCWMAENLDYDDGCTSVSWANDTDKGWCGYHTDDSSQNHGLLYQWSAAMSGDSVADGDTTTSVQGICPEGWLLPSDSELHTLENYLATGSCDGGRSGSYDCDPAGDQLKGNSEGNWCNGSPCGESGFEALAGGDRHTNGSFYRFGSYAYFWSSSPSGSDAWSRYLRSSNSGVHRNGELAGLRLFRTLSQGFLTI